MKVDLRMTMGALLALGLIAVSGCVTYQLPRYSIASENVAALKRAGKSKVSVGAFRAESIEDGKVGYRACKGGGWLATEDGKPFAEYVRRALISDLSIAERYDPSSQDIVTGELRNISIDYFTWTLKVDVALHRASKGTAAATIEKKVRSSLDPNTTCVNIKEALVPAIQDAIGELAKSPVLSN